MYYNKQSFVEKQVRSELTKTIKTIKTNLPNKQAENPITSSVENFFNENYEQFAGKIEDFLTSDSVEKLIKEKIVPFAQKPIQDFIDKNASKKDEYLRNPSLLMDDIEAEFPFATVLEYLDEIVLGVFIVSTAYSMWLVFLGPLGLTTATLAEVGKYFARKAIVDFLKKKGKDYLKKIIAQMTLKQLSSLIGSGALGVAKGLVGEALRQARTIVLIDVVLGLMKDISFEVLKQILIEEGIRRFGLSKEIVKQISGADKQSALQRILINAKKRIGEDLIKLFFTMEGYQKLGLGAAIEKLLFAATKKRSAFHSIYLKHQIFDLISKPKFKQKLEEMKQKLPPELQQPTILTPQLSKTKDEILDNLKTLFRESKLPIVLFDPFGAEVTQEKDLRDKDKAIEDSKKLVENGKILESEIIDNYKEIAMIEFVRDNFEALKKKPEELNLVLEDALDRKNINLDSLMEEVEIDDIKDYFKKMIADKNELVDHLLRRLAIDKYKIKELSNVLLDKIDIHKFKLDLKRELFGYE